MNKERVMKVLLAPHVSEKSTVIADKDHQFVFQVLRDANKNEVKQAVEHLFQSPSHHSEIRWFLHHRD